MALTPGTRLGAYEIVSAIGAGGMGEVYRARDTKLDRLVAIKILPDSVAHDSERIARFEREAKTLAALNHPNIATIYGVEEADGLRAIAMELIEGPTLADVIARAPDAESPLSRPRDSEAGAARGAGAPRGLELDDVLLIARQIAGAVDAAHEQGIVHRDLKPANIKLRPDGTVKVLDFGLAKALEPVGVSSSASQSPTITTPAMTQAGMILGTAAYVSPEQAKGRPADKRADVWAFGCVLYEMLTGRRAFEGEDTSDTLAAILRGEPDWDLLPAEVPVPIRALLKGCLTKDRRQRITGLSAASFVLDHQAHPVLEIATPAIPPPRRSLSRQIIPIAAAIIVGLAVGFGAWTLKPAAPLPVRRFAVALGDGETFTTGTASPLALSPDGSRLAYAANNRLYLRSLDRLDATPIAGVDNSGISAARTPFFSPDGQWLAFWEVGQLKKVSVSGGAPVALSVGQGTLSGASWSADNTILVGMGARGIWRVPANGGTLEQIITLDAGQRAHGPQLLPDGRTVLFTLAQTASWDEAQIVIQSLETGTRRTLVPGGTDGRYLPTGHLVYALREALLAVAFDPSSLGTVGGPVPMVEGVRRQGGALNPSAQFAVAFDGTLAYVPPVSVIPAARTLVWVDRQGREEVIAGAPSRPYTHPRLDPDRNRLAVEIQDESQNQDIWVWDFARGSLEKVTSDPSADTAPMWTPDGQRIIFSSMRTGTRHLFWQAANGTGTAEQLVDGNRQVIVAYTVSPDGRYLVFRGARQSSSELMMVDRGAAPSAQRPSFGVGEQKPLVQTSFEEINAEISPDGRWLAYQSNSSGAFEVYVRPFPDVATNQYLVSTGGGTEPLWSRDSRELFYRAPKGAVMRVSIANGPTWTAGTPLRLFEGTPYVLAEPGQFAFRTYDVSSDGRRFLMLRNPDTPAEAAPEARIVLVQNWFEELKRAVPTK